MTSTGSPMGVGALVDERYAVESLLGSGGAAEVYLARELATDRAVALKVLSPRSLGTDAQVERFRREAAPFKRLHHDNIARLYEVGAHEGRAYLASEYVEGISVDRLLARAGRLEWLLAVHVVNQAAAGLSIAHAQGILHRDVKPGNLMIGTLGDETGHVWLVDFGVPLALGYATPVGEPASADSPMYTDPQREAGAAPDVSADLFALGVTLYVLLTGHSPYAASERLQAGGSGPFAAQSGAPRSLGAFLHDYPDELDALVASCLARRPEERPQSAEAVQAAIQHMFRDAAPAGQPLSFALVKAQCREGWELAAGARTSPTVAPYFSQRVGVTTSPTPPRMAPRVPGLRWLSGVASSDRGRITPLVRSLAGLADATLEGGAGPTLRSRTSDPALDVRGIAAGVPATPTPVPPSTPDTPRPRALETVLRRPVLAATAGLLLLLGVLALLSAANAFGGDPPAVPGAPTRAPESLTSGSNIAAPPGPVGTSSRQLERGP